MKTALIILGTVVLVLVVAAGALAGLAFFGARPAAGTAGWGPRMMAGRGWGMMGRNPGAAACSGGAYGPGMFGSGMMGWGQGGTSGGYAAPQGGATLSMDEALSAANRYVDGLGTKGLAVGEVMEFESNFYALVVEKDSGVGAMELLVDKSTGAVGPEMGPNMMWNAKYGMMASGRRGMMGGYTASGEMGLSPEEAAKAAQSWLDANLPGRQAGDADPFYGYYTFHFLKDGQIDGMLSVNGSSGDVWFHSWHGDFLQMVQEGDQL
jgi:hypothetical protein